MFLVNAVQDIEDNSGDIAFIAAQYAWSIRVIVRVFNVPGIYSSEDICTTPKGCL